MVVFSLSPDSSQILSHFSTFSPWQNLGVACERPSRVRVRVHIQQLSITPPFSPLFHYWRQGENTCDLCLNSTVQNVLCYMFRTWPPDLNPLSKHSRGKKRSNNTCTCTFTISNAHRWIVASHLTLSQWGLIWPHCHAYSLYVCTH